MKNPSAPSALGALATAVFFATTALVSAQDLTPDTSECSDCGAVVGSSAHIDADLGGFEPAGDALDTQNDQVQDIEPHSNWPESGIPSPDMPTPVMIADASENGEPDTDVTTEVAVDDVTIYQDAVDLPTFEATPDIETTSNAESVTLTSAVSENNAAPHNAQAATNAVKNTTARSPHRDDRRVAAASSRVKGNICTDAQMYVSFLCAWQGFERP